MTLHAGDNRESLRRLIDKGVRVHAVVTDPPYGLVSVQKRFGKEGSAPARTEKNDGSFARLSGGFMGKCFHPSTEIMTDHGWRLVAEIVPGDKVATLNPTTRELEWQAVEQTHAYPFDGDLVHVKHRSAEQMITPNHRIVVSHDGGVNLELIEPGQTRAHFHMLAQAKPVTGIRDLLITIASEREYGRDREIVWDNVPFNAKAFFRFFGLWLGDGYTVTRTDDHPANDFFGFAVKKVRKVDAIRRALIDLKINFTETPSTEGRITHFYCYNFALLGFLKKLGKASEKHIPTWMFEYDAALLEELYNGLMDTDGCRQGKGQEVYYTISARLAGDFQRLCLHTGRSAISVFKPGGEKVTINGRESVSSDSWTLCVLQPGKWMYGERGTTNSNVIFKSAYAGYVYCVGVPKHHIIYTRYNGKPVWSGNSWDASGIERDPEFWKLVYEILLPGGYVFAFSGSRTGHWQACAMELAGFIMHPMHGWVFGCMDTETECLTRRGWLSYTNLLPTDEVLQWDSVTDTLSWVIPEHIHEYDFDGKMVQIRNRHTHQVLTPNHRVYAKVRRHSRHPKPKSYEVVEAREVHQRPSNWQVNLPMASHLEGSTVVDPAYAYLVGWWLTDAWPHKDANACCFSQSKPATLAKLRTALEGLGASEYVKAAKRDTHNDEHTFYLAGPMADRLRAEFPERLLEWEVLSWSVDARRALYEGLMDGDGSRNKTGQIAEAFWSQKQERRDVFLALALSVGIRCYEDPVKGVVYVNPKTRTTQVQYKHRADLLPYEGKVWCLTVPTGAFVVRRSGRPFITGNSGFPKAHAADKAIDKMLGVEGGFVPDGAPLKRMIPGADQNKQGWEKNNGREYQPGQYVPGSPEAEEWDGWAYGTQAQKPALEPIYLGQKPFSTKTGAENLLKYGVGAVNIDGCRVPGIKDVPASPRRAAQHETYGDLSNDPGTGSGWDPNTGRHPSNLILDGSDDVVAMFPAKAGAAAPVRGSEPSDAIKNTYNARERVPGAFHGNSGSAARFFHHFPPDTDPLFYHPKAGKGDRAGSKHPTVKPIALMQYLIRHITPPGGTVLDPFAGSGTTAEAARREGFDCILMEAESEYVEFLCERFGLPAKSLPKPTRKLAADLMELLGGATKAKYSLDLDDIL